MEPAAAQSIAIQLKLRLKLLSTLDRCQRLQPAEAPHRHACALHPATVHTAHPLAPEALPSSDQMAASLGLQ
jgi:hypothetical protein